MRGKKPRIPFRYFQSDPAASRHGLKVTRPVLRISRSFEGHCALTNADEANEVQQNVVTAKKGKKRGIKAILRRSR